MRQLLGWGLGVIVVGLLVGLLAVTGLVVAGGILPWLAGVLLVVGIVMAIIGAGGHAAGGTRV